MITASELLSRAAAVLLDFDGPVAPLMPAPLNRQVADAARRVLLDAGVALPLHVSQTADHLAVLRYVWNSQRSHLDDVEAACIAGEIMAAQQCTPTAGAHDFLTACVERGMPVAIVSNNSADAIALYLDRYGLRDTATALIGRELGRPDLMKPNPHALRKASAALGVSPADTVMVGDSVSDIVAAHSVSAMAIGYGKTPRRAVELTTAGADVVIEAMPALAASTL